MTAAIEPLPSELKGAGIPPAPATKLPARKRWPVLLAAAIWLLTVAMGLAVVWVGIFTDYVLLASQLNGATPSADDLLVFHSFVIALFTVVVGYASVGALLAGRAGAGRIAALLLAGGALFALAPFGYAVGGSFALRDPESALMSAFLLLGPVATGPAFATVLPGLAIAFPDGRLPSPRWRWPVGITVGIIGVGTILNLVRPGPVGGGAPGKSPNPFGIDALPTPLADGAYVLVAIGILAMTVVGVAAVVVRYRRGSDIERQQQRWFVAAVAVAALPLALSTVPGIGGPAAGLVAVLGLMLIPIAVGIAVTRYRLYEIDHLINRTLVYVPLTALLAGLYAATVALLQRVFQSVTGDKSDAAIIISTLILASVFTPLRKWLEGIVERRFKPAAPGLYAGPATIATADGPEWDARVAAVALRAVRAAEGPESEARIAAIALRVVRTELESRAVHEPPAG
jgi:hypothetical protein